MEEIVVRIELQGKYTSLCLLSVAHHLWMHGSSSFLDLGGDTSQTKSIQALGILKSLLDFYTFDPWQK